MKFSINARLQNGLGRAGAIETPHGTIETPAFIPVATKATVKSLAPEQIRDVVGAQAVLSNAYHLYLQAGTDVLAKAGGLGRFMNWSDPTFTDSGGFQAFSLQGGMKGRKSKFLESQDTVDQDGGQIVEGEGVGEIDQADAPGLAKVDDDGVTFKSIIDGSTHRFTPERSIEIQHAIGADIIF